MNHQIISFLIPITILGLLIGSFLNVVIYRLPIMSKRKRLLSETEEVKALFIRDNKSREYDLSKPFNLNIPHSACPRCNHVITPIENIPLISWLALRGKCSGCRLPISKRYPLIELLTGILFGCVAFISTSWFMLISLSLFVCVTLSAICITYDKELIPYSIKALVICTLVITVISFYI